MKHVKASRNIYFSFLGLGSRDPATGQYRYHSTVYELKGQHSRPTAFVQAAEMELLGGERFDRVLIAATEASRNAHFNDMASEMAKWNACPEPMILKEDFTPAGQWSWFEKILRHIEPKDALTIDLTHGFRSFPIVFSAAINFLQKARDVSLEAVYYGVWERAAALGYAPIIDMRAFYLINEWAESVSRLVEDADARKMAMVAEATPDFQMGELNDPEMVRAFVDLTDTIRNVDVNHVGQKADAALRLVAQRRASASVAGRLLLDLVVEKFERVAVAQPPDGRYDRGYFHLQLEIIRMLLDHKLYMQAYTVMRELIASIGMVGVNDAALEGASAFLMRRRFGEVFVAMTQFPSSRWKFHGQAAADCSAMVGYYERLKAIGVIAVLEGFAQKLAALRNSFDHAWTARQEVPKNVAAMGGAFLARLEEVVEMMTVEGIL